MREAPWDANDSLEIIKLDPTDTFGGKQLNRQRLEAIAEWFALPLSQRDGHKAPRNILELARRLGCSPATIRGWQREPRMLQRTIDKIRMAAVYSMPNVLEGQVLKATNERDTTAAKFVKATALMDPEPGGTQVNVGIAVRTGASESDTAFMQRFQSTMSAGVLRQIAAHKAVAQGPEDEEDEEEEGNVGDESVDAEPEPEREQYPDA